MAFPEGNYPIPDEINEPTGESTLEVDKSFHLISARRYDVPQNVLDRLSPTVIEAGDRFALVADQVERLYQMQKEITYYPDEHMEPTEEELQQWATINPGVLSQYTYVRFRGDEIITPSFHDMFPDLTNKIAASLKAVPAAFRPDVWADYGLPSRAVIESTANAFITDDWIGAEREGLTKHWNVDLDILVGPIETQHDTLGRKGSYQMTVGYVDAEDSERAGDIVYMALKLQPRQPAPEVGVKILHLLANAGSSAEDKYNAQALPNDANLRDELRKARIRIYDKEFVEKYTQKLKPIVNELFDQNTMPRNETVLLEAAKVWLLLHEAGHPLHRTPGQQERFGASFNTFDEERCDARVPYLANILRYHHRINDDMFRAIWMIHIARKFDDIADFKFANQSGPKWVYTRGSIAETNFLNSTAPFIPDTGKLNLNTETLNTLIEQNEVWLRMLDYHADTPGINRRDLEQFFRRYERRGGRPFQFIKRLRHLYQTDEQPKMGKIAEMA